MNADSHLRFDNQVAIVTGAGGGLGRAHALALAARGACVVVNDLSISACEAVAQEIATTGGKAVAHHGSVTDTKAVADMVQSTMSRWGRVDILVNNAGFLRDKSFSKMTLEDFNDVINVHLMGTVICTQAVWDVMRTQKYGRIVMTTSSSGLYGNFGQSNYSAAKMALVGLMQTLSIEGAKFDIRVNCLAPTAATQMTQGLLPDSMWQAFQPKHVSPGLLVLVAKDAPNRTILCAGAGTFAAAHITMTDGAYIGTGSDAPEQLHSHWQQVLDPRQATIPASASAQATNEAAKAMKS
jgi:NAD(P)-dependent dehydrogenase (short-subunit alcohol dehydrogenase family)